MSCKNSIFKKKDDIVRRDIADETLLVPIRGSIADMQKIFALDEVSGFIWDQLEVARPYSEILDAVAENYDVAREQADKDLEEFLTALQEADLVIEVDQ
jgi:hypothetical protein